MKKVLKKGEIATILTIATFVLVTAASIISSVFLTKSRQTTKSLAQEGWKCPGGNCNQCYNEWWWDQGCFDLADNPPQPKESNICRCSDMNTCVKYDNTLKEYARVPNGTLGSTWCGNDCRRHPEAVETATICSTSQSPSTTPAPTNTIAVLPTHSPTPPPSPTPVGATAVPITSPPATPLPTGQLTVSPTSQLVFPLRFTFKGKITNKGNGNLGDLKINVSYKADGAPIKSSQQTFSVQQSGDYDFEDTAYIGIIAFSKITCSFSLFADHGSVAGPQELSDFECYPARQNIKDFEVTYPVPMASETPTPTAQSQISARLSGQLTLSNFYDYENFSCFVFIRGNINEQKIEEYKKRDYEVWKYEDRYGVRTPFFLLSDKNNPAHDWSFDNLAIAGEEYSLGAGCTAYKGVWQQDFSSGYIFATAPKDSINITINTEPPPPLSYNKENFVKELTLDVEVNAKLKNCPDKNQVIIPASKLKLYIFGIKLGSDDIFLLWTTQNSPLYINNDQSILSFYIDPDGKSAKEVYRLQLKLNEESKWSDPFNYLHVQAFILDGGEVKKIDYFGRYYYDDLLKKIEKIDLVYDCSSVSGPKPN